jgi:formylmethanofuran dehydrogenase subunit E
MDNLDMFYKHDKEEIDALKRLPVCDGCGEPIQSEYMYEIGSEQFCEDCKDIIVKEGRKRVEA